MTCVARQRNHCKLSQMAPEEINKVKKKRGKSLRSQHPTDSQNLTGCDLYLFNYAGVALQGQIY